MNTNTIVGLVIAILVVGGGAWYFTSNQGENTGAPQGASDEKKETTMGEGTLASLIARAGSWKCTVSMTSDVAPSSGVAYIANGKVRADFTSSPAASGTKEVHSSMIQTDGYVYTWSDMMAQGMKMKVPSATDPAVSEMTPEKYTEQVSYTCEPWMADGSLFIPPAEVSFLDPGSLGVPGGIPQLPEGVEMPQGYPTPN